jgi:hypothetical protein
MATNSLLINFQAQRAFSPIQTTCYFFVFIFSFLSFVSMGDAEVYKLQTAYQFTLAIGVIVWLYAFMLVLTRAALVRNIYIFAFDVDELLRRGNRLTCFLSYTGMIKFVRQSMALDLFTQALYF